MSDADRLLKWLEAAGKHWDTVKPEDVLRELGREPDRVEELEAQAAGMREALEHCRHRPHEHNPGPDFTITRCEVIDRALASDAGRVFLERLEKAERVNNRRLCGCEESLGVFGCRVACPCRCHEARARALEEAAQLLERYPKPKYIKGLAAAIRALCGKRPE